ncbi:VWA domain-containing protein [Granulicella mallensis]|uniref:VWFA-related domain-containing protein n=1 Tax=Granulicella mallensis (strain ATCC BAA-1857 / DSM 23137 / MP5ACTX8) TaxID=682795 RepID=G8NVW8_GRAMM|nr:VWA domain-containing protein [Granulicella mallensis]AEU38871.1 VWFA-related domain-containing protein [Granulicella mallensis MP5ACTX8]
MRSLSASVFAAASASRPLSLSLVLALSLGLTAGAQQPAAPAAAPDPAAALAQTPAQAPTQVEQQPAPSTPANTIRRNVNLVVLDGVVVDQKGKVVTDLKREEFHITEDGAPQQVRNFETPGQFTPTPDVTINSTADLDHLAPRAPVNIVLLDEFNTRFEDMAFARYSLKKWLEKQPDKLDTPTMLIAVDLQHFTVLRDYTQNKDEILSALDHHFVAYPWQVHEFAWIAERYTTALYSLRRVAEASIGHFGHKNMIWIGRGFPTLDFARISVDDQQHVHSAVEQTVNELRDARVTLYTVDPAGVQVNPGVYGRDAGIFAAFGGDPDFQALARATGGRNLYGRNDVDAEIGTSIRDGSSLYTLTYVPTNNTEDEHNKLRRIQVTLDRPGLTFITRQGYYPNRFAARPTRDGRMGNRLVSELANAGSSNMAYDAVSFTVTTSPTDSNTYKFHVEPRGVAWYITDGTKPRFTRLIIMSTAFDRKGKELKADARRLEFKAPAAAPSTGRIELPLDFEVKFDAVPKAVRTRMVVRVEASGRMGTADLTLGPGATASSFITQDAAAPAGAPATP